MRKPLLRTALFTLVAAAAASAGFAVRSSTAQDQVYAWGISNQGETCGGTCGENNICCRITVVEDEKPANP